MKFSEESTKRICGYIRLGLLQKDVCELMNITPQTFSEWKRTKPEFSSALKEAEFTAKAYMLQLLLEHAKSNVSAVMFYLSRKYPGEWSETGSVEKQLEHIADRISKLEEKYEQNKQTT